MHSLSINLSEGPSVGVGKKAEGVTEDTLPTLELQGSVRGNEEPILYKREETEIVYFRLPRSVPDYFHFENTSVS